MNVYLGGTELSGEFLQSTGLEGIYLGGDEVLSSGIKFTLQSVPSGNQTWLNVANALSAHASDGCQGNYSDGRYTSFRYVLSGDDGYRYTFGFKGQYGSSLTAWYGRVLQLNNDGSYRGGYDCVSLSEYGNFNEVREYIYDIIGDGDITGIQSLGFSDLSAFMNDFISKSGTFTPAS